jgi:hypothetical protein
VSLKSIYKKIDPLTIDKWEHYLDIYTARLPKGRKKPLTILEIGVQGGGSLKMWRQYFGSNCKIVGVDIDEQCLKLASKDISIVIGNQGDVGFLDRLIVEFGPFDIVIDDGSHVGHDQITSFKRLIRHTRHLYIVEDTHTSYWGQWQPISESFISFAKGLVDDLHMYFILANSSEVYGEEAWSKIVGKRSLGGRSYLRSISFHDSMAVFETGAMGPPLRRRRGSAPK